MDLSYLPDLFFCQATMLGLLNSTTYLISDQPGIQLNCCVLHFDHTFIYLIACQDTYLCAESCCNGEKKDFQVESGPFQWQFFHKNAKKNIKLRNIQKIFNNSRTVSFFRYTGMVRYCVICINVSKIEVIYIIFLFCRRYM